LDWTACFNPVQILRERLTGLGIHIEAVLPAVALVGDAPELASPPHITFTTATGLLTETRQRTGRTSTHRAMVSAALLFHSLSLTNLSIHASTSLRRNLTDELKIIRTRFVVGKVGEGKAA
jgi:hypothetical protein